MPEVVFEKSWERNVPRRSSKPEPRSSFSIISLPNINTVLFWPKVHHLSGSYGKWISKNRT